MDKKVLFEALNTELAKQSKWGFSIHQKTWLKDMV